MSVDESAIQDDDPLVMAVLVRLRPLLQEFEGFRPRPYLCPAARWTIGYGSTFYADGRSVKPNDPPISHVTAWRLAVLTIKNEFLPGVRRACPQVTDPARLAALVSFAYNFGVPRLMQSTLRVQVNRGAWAAAAKELLRWVFSGGQRTAGLVRRRSVEALILLHGSAAYNPRI